MTSSKRVTESTARASHLSKIVLHNARHNHVHYLHWPSPVLYVHYLHWSDQWSLYFLVVVPAVYWEKISVQIAAAVAIIVIIPVHLQQIQWDPTRFQGLKFWDGFVESDACLLGSGFRNAHLCTYGIVAAGVSVAASLLISLMQVMSSSVKA